MLRLTIGVLTLSALAASAQASQITEIEPNNSIGFSQLLDGHFSLDFNPDIGDAFGNTSTAIPHVTVLGTGDDTLDYYALTVAVPGSRAIFDIDYAQKGTAGNEPDTWDSYLRLFNSSNVLLGSADDTFPATIGAGGSTAFSNTGTWDSYLEYVFSTPGTYFIEVGRFGSPQPLGVPSGKTYELQVSLENAATVPEPVSVSLLGLGLAGLAARRRRRQS